jgi:RNA polymerase primary sigma factor
MHLHSDTAGLPEDIIHHEVNEDAPCTQGHFPVHSERVVGDSALWWQKQMEKFPLLTPEAELSVARRIAEGDQRAFEEMVECNLRWVFVIAQRHLSLAGSALTLSDLIQEGTCGLMRAARKFDYRRGYKFSTYSTFWIRQAIMRAIIDTGRAIRLPVHVQETLSRTERARTIMTQCLGRTPSDVELSSHLNMAPIAVRLLLDRAQEPVSLDAVICDEHAPASLEDWLEDGEAVSPLESTTETLVRERIQSTVGRALSALPAREAEVVRLRYGIDGEPMTLEQVARRLKLTRERVRQIENQAVSRLRNCGFLRDLASEL